MIISIGGGERSLICKEIIRVEIRYSEGIESVKVDKATSTCIGNQNRKQISYMSEILIVLLTAIIGGLIGTYFGARFLNMREESKLYW